LCEPVITTGFLPKGSMTMTLLCTCTPWFFTSVSALEWILDQYKEKTPKDPTIREKFNTYRFADHKEKVIDLLKRVMRVSVETMKIVEAMQAEKR
jgi:predicted helicase